LTLSSSGLRAWQQRCSSLPWIGRSREARTTRCLRQVNRDAGHRLRDVSVWSSVGKVFGCKSKTAEHHSARVSITSPSEGT